MFDAGVLRFRPMNEGFSSGSGASSSVVILRFSVQKNELLSQFLFFFPRLCLRQCARKVFDQINYCFSIFLAIFLKGKSVQCTCSECISLVLIFGDVDCMVANLSTCRPRKYLLGKTHLLAETGPLWPWSLWAIHPANLGSLLRSVF